MKNNKFSYLIICLIIIFFSGCNESDSTRKPIEKKARPIIKEFQLIELGKFIIKPIPIINIPNNCRVLDK